MYKTNLSTRRCISSSSFTTSNVRVFEWWPLEDFWGWVNWNEIRTFEIKLPYLWNNFHYQTTSVIMDALFHMCIHFILGIFNFFILTNVPNTIIIIHPELFWHEYDKNVSLCHELRPHFSTLDNRHHICLTSLDKVPVIFLNKFPSQTHLFWYH